MDSLFLYVQEGERYLCGTTIFGHTTKKCPNNPNERKKLPMEKNFCRRTFFCVFPIFLLLLQVETVVEKKESL